MVLSTKRSRIISFSVCLLCAAATALWAADAGPMKPIDIAQPDRTTPVDFESEILPILNSNCLACHNKSKPKASLILETPAEILKGGDNGPAAVAGKGSESLMLKAAAHQIADTRMPPAGNKVAAADLTPQQLGLLKVWIDQGATGQVRASAKVEWRAVAQSWNPIYAVAVTADGQYAACGRANRISLYHVPTGRQVAQIFDPSLGPGALAHNDVVNALAFSPDGHQLASGGYREIKLWRRATSGNVASLGDEKGESAAVKLARTSDAATIATGSKSGVIRLFAAATGALIAPLEGHTAAINAIQFSANDTRLASASADKSVRVWDVAARKVLAKIDLADEPKAIAWAAAGKKLVVGGSDKVLRVFSVPEGEGELSPVKEIPAQPGDIIAMASMSEPAQILCATAEGSLRILNVENGQTVRQIAHGGPIVAATVSSDGKRIASAGADKVIRVFTAEKGEKVAELRGDGSAALAVAAKGWGAGVAKAAAGYRKSRRDDLEKQGKELADRAKKAADELAAAGKDLPAKEQAVKDATDAKKRAEDEKQGDDKIKAADKTLSEAQKEMERLQSAKQSAETESKLAAAAVEKSAKDLADATAALTAADEAQKRFETEAAEAKKSAGEHDAVARAITFSPDGLLIASIDDAGAIHAWSSGGPLPGVALETVEGPKDATGITFGITGRVIVSTADAPANYYNIEPDWTLERKLGSDAAPGAVAALPATSATPQSASTSRPVDPTVLSDRINALAYSPDGKFLASGGGVPSRAGEIRVWELATGGVKWALDEVHTDTILALDFSSDGALLATGSADHFVKVIDLANGQLLKSFEGHSHHVLGVAWRRGTRTLASSSADNTVRIWDLDSGEMKKNVGGYNKEVAALSFIGDTDQILTAGGEGRIRLIKSDGGEVKSFSGASDFVYGAAASFDGSIVAAGGQEGILRLWNGASGSLFETFTPAGSTASK